MIELNTAHRLRSMQDRLPIEATHALTIEHHGNLDLLNVLQEAIEVVELLKGKALPLRRERSECLGCRFCTNSGERYLQFRGQGFDSGQVRAHLLDVRITADTKGEGGSGYLALKPKGQTLRQQLNKSKANDEQRREQRREYRRRS